MCDSFMFVYSPHFCMQHLLLDGVWSAFYLAANICRLYLVGRSKNGVFLYVPHDV